jgi:chromate transporter
LSRKPNQKLTIKNEAKISDELPLVIDDHAPPPAHNLPNGMQVFKILAVGLILWILPFLLIGLWRGFDSLHAQKYRYFTQAALVTFGWITKAQAVDGLALAETTPGPLIMVLQFIGFMAAWNNHGEMNQTASAITGALITTYVTFLPSFLFIFIGAPYIEVLLGRNFFPNISNRLAQARSPLDYSGQPKIFGMPFINIRAVF